jgi:hypothetical protein
MTRGAYRDELGALRLRKEALEVEVVELRARQVELLEKADDLRKAEAEIAELRGKLRRLGRSARDGGWQGRTPAGGERRASTRGASLTMTAAVAALSVLAGAMRLEGPAGAPPHESLQDSGAWMSAASIAERTCLLDSAPAGASISISAADYVILFGEVPEARWHMQESFQIGSTPMAIKQPAVAIDASIELDGFLPARIRIAGWDSQSPGSGCSIHVALEALAED